VPSSALSAARSSPADYSQLPVVPLRSDAVFVAVRLALGCWVKDSTTMASPSALDHSAVDYGVSESAAGIGNGGGLHVPPATIKLPAPGTPPLI